MLNREERRASKVLRRAGIGTLEKTGAGEYVVLGRGRTSIFGPMTWEQVLREAYPEIWMRESFEKGAQKVEAAVAKYGTSIGLCKNCLRPGEEHKSDPEGGEPLCTEEALRANDTDADDDWRYDPWTEEDERAYS